MTNQEEISFINEIRQRFLMPWKPFNWAFAGYLFGIIIAFGGLGVWASIYLTNVSNDVNWTSITSGLSTYFIALLATGFIDLNLITNIKNQLSEKIYSALVFGFGFLLLFLSNAINSYYAFIPAILGTLFSIFIWIIANADSEKFNEITYGEKMRGDAKLKHGNNWK